MASKLMEKYQYYAKPEGQDPVGKILGLAKYAIAGTPFIAVYDAILYSHCKTPRQFLNTFGYWFVPLTGMCVAFSTVTYTMTTLRKKDDTLNYVAGALASSSILHAWQKSVVISGFGTAIMCLYAMLKKDLMKNIDKYEFKNLVLLTEGQIKKEYVTWRNLPHRDYTPKPVYPINRESAYRHFNIH